MPRHHGEKSAAICVTPAEGTSYEFSQHGFELRRRYSRITRQPAPSSPSESLFTPYCARRWFSPRHVIRSFRQHDIFVAMTSYCLAIDFHDILRPASFARSAVRKEKRHVYRACAQKAEGVPQSGGASVGVSGGARRAPGAVREVWRAGGRDEQMPPPSREVACSHR